MSHAAAKEAMSKTKRQPTEWEKIFPNDATYKGSSLKYTNSSCSSTSKNKQKIYKWADLNRDP